MENLVRTSIVDENNPMGLLTGLLIGGLTGFGAMLLLAPQSGKKISALIRQKSTQLQDRATDTFDDLVVLSHFDNRRILVGTRQKNKNG
jgi:gas vesicle protein